MSTEPMTKLMPAEGLDPWELWEELRHGFTDGTLEDQSIIEGAMVDHVTLSMLPALERLSAQLANGSSNKLLSPDGGIVVAPQRGGADLVFLHKHMPGAVFIAIDTDTASLFAASLPAGGYMGLGHEGATDMAFNAPMLEEILVLEDKAVAPGRLISRDIPSSSDEAPILTSNCPLGMPDIALTRVSECLSALGLAPIVNDRSHQLAQMSWRHNHSACELPLIQLGLALGASSGGMMTPDLYKTLRNLTADRVTAQFERMLPDLWDVAGYVLEAGAKFPKGSQVWGDGYYRLRAQEGEMFRSLLVDFSGRQDTITLWTGDEGEICGMTIHEGKGTKGRLLCDGLMEDGALRGSSYSEVWGQKIPYEFESVSAVNNLVSLAPEMIEDVAASRADPALSL